MKSGTQDIALGMLAFLPFAVVLAAGIGWVMNIWKIALALGSNEITTMFVARCIGAFIVPVGAVLGWF